MNTQKLKSYRRRINRQIKELGSTPKGLFNNLEMAESLPDEYDRAAHEYDSGFQFIFRDRERKLIYGLRGAVNRIEKGVFGICESCGSKIPEKRLQANPLAVLCIDCKKKEEKGRCGKKFV